MHCCGGCLCSVDILAIAVVIVLVVDIFNEELDNKK